MLARPMLAAKTEGHDLSKLRYPLLLSPKIDGIRALICNGKMLSRTLKEIPNAATQTFFSSNAIEGMDGELVVGSPCDRNLMQQTSSGVMSHTGDPKAVYYVFDLWSSPKVYASRLEDLREVCRVCDSGRISYLHHHLVSTYEELIYLEESYVNLGYEGVMLRDPFGPYKQGRSTLREGFLLKVKRFVDAEAQIIGYTELLHNLNEPTLDERGYTKRSTERAGKVGSGMLGSFTVRDLSTGVEFEVGSGFTESQRVTFWAQRQELLFSLLTYKTMPHGVKDKPRFPIFKALRSPLDV